MEFLVDDKKSLADRKRNILFLISQYLTDFGYTNAVAMLIKESNLPIKDYQICDNIDLDSIYMDYITYNHVKFGKYPKIVKKIEIPNDQNFLKIATSNGNGRKKSQPQKNNLANNNSKDLSDIESNKNTISDEVLLKSSIIVSQLGNNNKSSLTLTPESIQQTNNDVVISDKYLRPFREYEFYSPEWSEMAELMCRDIIKKDLKVRWDDVKGHAEARSILTESVVLPLKYPDIFVGITKPWKCILLHGPPGTGKTLLARALYSQIREHVTFFNVSSGTIISKWRGDSEKYIRVLFEVATFYAPSIIFIDEIEGLTCTRDATFEHEASKRFKNEFLKLIDGLDECNSKVLLLATTNLPWEIDAAFLRRFEKKILIGLPDKLARNHMIEHFMPNSKKWSENSIEDILNVCDGFTGDEIRIACKEASMSKIRTAIGSLKSLEAFEDKHKINDLIREVTANDLQLALSQMLPTSGKLLEKHKKWIRKFND